MLGDVIAINRSDFVSTQAYPPRTGKPYKTTLVNASSVKMHMIQKGHPVDPDRDFTILSRGGSREILDIKESIMIARLKPILNGKESSAPLFLYR